MTVTIKDIEEARSNLLETIQPTQTLFSRSTSDWLGTDVYLKYENEQMTGSFKMRGAYNKISSLTPEEKAKGIVASSAGNHAQGVALSATRLGTKAHIVMPVNSPLIKISATQSYGAEVILHGEFYDEAYELARNLERDRGYVFVHPFEDAKIIAGQGTIGLELLDKVPDLDSVVVPIGGGGLISGIATAIKAKRPQCKIYGVISENTPGMFHMFKGGQAVQFTNRPTIADGTAVKKPSEAMFKNYISRLVDDVVRVKDDEIAEAMVFLLERAKTVVEGAGAMALAAAAKKSFKLGKKTALVLSGGNVDLNALANIIERGLGRRGRLARLKVIVSDMPGTMHRLTAVIAEKRANILEVYHDRLGMGLDISETSIEFLLETRSKEHVEEIKKALAEAGSRVV
ncbi:MAG: threonine ammonia-lyase [Bdellovibrionaceae bacterium]|nr:threonine ammonia-lyase [Bdellovibrionales bacterium]MCB9085818.1 threonine ammonia-lyase [Pseudobdellovibrionaceae bacterium]